MVQYRKHFALAAAGLLLASAAQAGVSVHFVHADGFSDLPHAPAQRQQALDDFAAHFRRLGEGLGPEQDLTIDVLDIDVAGRMAPNRAGGDEIRVVHGGAEWPRMGLRYTLSEHGRTVASGEAQLADQNFATRVNNYPGDARWSYEMQMIDDWWRKTIAPLAAGGR